MLAEDLNVNTSETGAFGRGFTTKSKKQILSPDTGFAKKISKSSFDVINFPGKRLKSVTKNYPLYKERIRPHFAQCHLTWLFTQAASFANDIYKTSLLKVIV